MRAPHDRAWVIALRARRRPSGLRCDAFWSAWLKSALDSAIGAIRFVVLNSSHCVSFQAEIRVPARRQAPTPGGVANVAFQF